MASFVSDDENSTILELGPGTGPVTKVILEKGVPPQKLTCVEFNKEFCKHLEEKFPDINVIQGDAFDLEKTLGEDKRGTFSVVLSGLPLLNFPTERRRRFITGALDFAAPDSNLIQLCYGPNAPVKFDDEITCTPTKWVLANVPPARFWIYTRRRD